MDTVQKPETFHLTAEAAEALPHQAQIGLQQVDNLKYFLISAPVDWAPDQYIRRFLLPTGEYVSCVLWSNLFHVSGTDIVRCLAFRFQAFGRPVKNAKKFEEGIFSDLRNLKAGTDASLEEPKSPFLDFLYKNNCIRTQKKQKVFYWYSVPHDRLFLDALERDLKREHAGQETTTVAESEPALSFDYDSSQSLFEQLTKNTQSKTSSDTPNHDGMHSNSSPSAGATQQTVSSNAIHSIGAMALNDHFSYSQAMPAALGPTPMQPPMNYTMTAPTNNGGYFNAPAYGPVGQHQMSYSISSSNGDVSHQRQNSMPIYYMESSPAPSFISNQSHYDDYSRAVSYEPVTPPQNGYNYTQEQFYQPTDDINYAVPKTDQYSNFNGTVQVTMSHTPQYRHNSVPRQYASNNAYSHIEGSPLYKQRRRNSSLTGYSAIGTMAPPAVKPTYAAHRPSDLRRSVSASVVPQDNFQRSSSGPPMSLGYMNELRQTPNASRQSSPMNEDGRSVSVTKRRYSSLVGDDFPNNAAGVLKRARSATVGETAENSQTKHHHCPIAGCGRAFGRLEHLKRHVRTHTQERPYQCDMCDKAFSRSDNLAQHKRTHESNNDGVGLELVQEEMPLGNDQSNSFVSDVSQVSMDGYLSGSQLGGTDNNNGFVMTDYSFASDMSGQYDTLGSMAPPPLPNHISGY